MAKSTFVTKNEKGEEWKLAVIHPTEEHFAEANAVQNKVFKKAVSEGALLSAALDKVMEEQGLWDESRQKKVEELAREINERRVKLKRGGMTKSEGKDVAMHIIEKTNEQRRLLANRAAYSSRTADGQSDNARFNYLVATCVVDDATGERVFSDMNDYENKNSNDYAVDAANKLADIMYSIGSDSESNAIEFRFLKKFGYIDEKLRFINADGHLTDKDGRLIDEEGRYVNDKGELVDLSGNRVDEEGEVVVDELPFLDDDGTELTTFSEEKTEEPVSA